MSDVVEGEGGEVPMPAASGSSTDASYEDYEPETSSSGAGTTSGAGTLQLEVQILSADAVDRVADEIARRVAAKVHGTKIKSITVVSPTIIAVLRLHSAIEAELMALEATTERLAAAAARAAAETGGEAGFAEVATVAAQTARNVLKSASSALRNLAVTTKYSGRTNVTRQAVLDAALAKHLAARKLTVEVPEHALPAIEQRGLFARMLALQARCRELQDSGPIEALTPVVNSVESLLNLVFGTSDATAAPTVPIAQQLMLADGVARDMIKGKAVLFAEIAFSGGSYRTRKWLLNFLFGSDGLTYSGGAGVTYFLFRGDDRATLDSDTLYFASRHGRFHHERSQRFDPTNISSSAA